MTDTTLPPKTMEWVTVRAREAGARVAAPRVVEMTTAHLTRWRALVVAATAAAEARLAAEEAEGVPHPPVYPDAVAYRAATLRHAAIGAVGGLWSPTEKMAWGSTPDGVLEEWGITRAEVLAATR